MGVTEKLFYLGVTEKRAEAGKDRGERGLIPTDSGFGSLSVGDNRVKLPTTSCFGSLSVGDNSSLASDHF